ncbi:hypothetical protein ACOZ4N_14870 [Halorientalis pallida]|uniref:hypothetical protein n=1 Tax=Halorientalis pallida TaxID=2479928 RepID=UPI003C703E3C
MNLLDRWNRALTPETRANLALNAALRSIALLALAALWVLETPEPGPQSLLSGAAVGGLVGGLNLALGRSVGFMRIWRDRTLLRVVVAGGVAGCFVFAVERALGATVLAAAVALTLSLGYHVALFVRMEEDF